MRLFSSLFKLAAGIVAGEAIVLMKKDKKFTKDLLKKKTFGDKAKFFFDRIVSFNKELIDEWKEVVKNNTPTMEEVTDWVHHYLKKAHDIGVEKWQELDKTFQSKEKLQEVIWYLETFKKYLKTHDKKASTWKKSVKKNSSLKK